MLRIESDRLRGADGFHEFEPMSPTLKFAPDPWSDRPFDAQLVRLPLVMESNLAQGFRERQGEINRIDDGENRLADDGGTAGRTDCQHRPSRP